MGCGFCGSLFNEGPLQPRNNQLFSFDNFQSQFENISNPQQIRPNQINSKIQPKLIIYLPENIINRQIIKKKFQKNAINIGIKIKHCFSKTQQLKSFHDDNERNILFMMCSLQNDFNIQIPHFQIYQSISHIYNFQNLNVNRFQQNLKQSYGHRYLKIFKYDDMRLQQIFIQAINIPNMFYYKQHLKNINRFFLIFNGCKKIDRNTLNRKFQQYLQYEKQQQGNPQQKTIIEQIIKNLDNVANLVSKKIFQSNFIKKIYKIIRQNNNIQIFKNVAYFIHIIDAYIKKQYHKLRSTLGQQIKITFQKQLTQNQRLQLQQNQRRNQIIFFPQFIVGYGDRNKEQRIQDPSVYKFIIKLNSMDNLLKNTDLFYDYGFLKKEDIYKILKISQQTRQIFLQYGAVATSFQRKKENRFYSPQNVQYAPYFLLADTIDQQNFVINSIKNQIQLNYILQKYQYCLNLLHKNEILSPQTKILVYLGIKNYQLALKQCEKITNQLKKIIYELHICLISSNNQQFITKVQQYKIWKKNDMENVIKQAKEIIKPKTTKTLYQIYLLMYYVHYKKYYQRNQNQRQQNRQSRYQQQNQQITCIQAYIQNYIQSYFLSRQYPQNRLAPQSYRSLPLYHYYTYIDNDKKSFNNKRNQRQLFRGFTLKWLDF